MLDQADFALGVPASTTNEACIVTLLPIWHTAAVYDRRAAEFRSDDSGIDVAVIDRGYKRVYEYVV